MCLSVSFKFLVHMNLICVLALAQDFDIIGDECTLTKGRRGECKLLRDCAEALREIVSFHRPHNFSRCGFQALEEIVCCPSANYPLRDVTPVPTSPAPARAPNPAPQSTRRPTPPPSPSSSSTTENALNIGNVNFAVPSVVSEDDNNFFDIAEAALQTEPPIITLHDKVQIQPEAVIQPHLTRADTECKKIVASLPPPLDNRIIGGTETDIQSFPHMAALGYEMGEEHEIQFLCGGALVSDLFVLTAAHCISPRPGSRSGPNVTLVRTGVKVINDSLRNHEADSRVAMLYIHPDYRIPLKYNDIGLVRLEKAITFSDRRQPACLFTGSTDPERNLIATGWGVVDWLEGKASEVLQMTSLSLFPRSECNKLLGNTRTTKDGLHEGQLCALGNKTDTCQGDSGGPLQAVTSPDGHYRLVGITSFGFGCATGKPAIYTRVAHYRAWIESTVWQI